MVIKYGSTSVMSDSVGRTKWRPVNHHLIAATGEHIYLQTCSYFTRQLQMPEIKNTVGIIHRVAYIHNMGDITFRTVSQEEWEGGGLQADISSQCCNLTPLLAEIAYKKLQ